MKKTIKTTLHAILALGLCLTMLTGCGGNGGDPTDHGGEVIRIGSLKGPTSMGLLYLMQEEYDRTGIDFQVQMATSADELLPLIAKGELDIALVPANVASVLYQKTGGEIAVIDINTLGVLYMVSGAEDVKEFSDLAGKTILLTGKGTTPDYVLQYLLAQNDMTDACTLEYKSEAAEVAAVLAENPDAVGLLPQPFVTAACMQNENLRVIFDMTEEWDKAQKDHTKAGRLVTGVTVVRREFLTEQEDLVQDFLREHAWSVEQINADPATGAVYAVAAGIVAKEPMAERAIPQCNITCITGEEMKEALSGYLAVLFEQAPESVGGALPGDAFYYVK